MGIEVERASKAKVMLFGMFVVWKRISDLRLMICDSATRIINLRLKIWDF